MDVLAYMLMKKIAGSAGGEQNADIGSLDPFTLGVLDTRALSGVSLGGQSSSLALLALLRIFSPISV